MHRPLNAAGDACSHGAVGASSNEWRGGKGVATGGAARGAAWGPACPGRPGSSISGGAHNEESRTTVRPTGEEKGVAGGNKAGGR